MIMKIIKIYILLIYKDNFIKLIENMNYKTLEKDKDIYFKYNPKKQIKKNFKKINPSDSPFKVLKDLNFN